MAPPSFGHRVFGGAVPRHNRTGKGVDQSGQEYEIGYQPDWLRRVKVTRKLKSGRQSTMQLFRNPTSYREATPGDKVRTRVTSVDDDVDFEVVLSDPSARVKRISVTYEIPPPEKGAGRRRKKPQEVVFTLENGLKPPRDP